MKYAIIGNSHVSALKRGWDSISAESAQVQLTFFASRAWSLESLKFNGQVLSSDDVVVRNAFRFTSGGQVEIRDADFDAFVLFGMWAQPFFLSNKPFYSSQVMGRAVQGHCQNSLSSKVLLQVRSMTKKPILVGHCPMPHPSVEGPSVSDREYIDGVAYVNRFHYANHGAELLCQPKETIIRGNRTDATFLNGSRRLSIGDKEDDLPHGANDPQHHANGDFGALWLKEHICKE